MNPTAFPSAKAVYGGLVAFLGSLGTSYTDGVVTAQEWVGIALATVVALGAVYRVTSTDANSGERRA